MLGQQSAPTQACKMSSTVFSCSSNLQLPNSSAFPPDMYRLWSRICQCFAYTFPARSKRRKMVEGYLRQRMDAVTSRDWSADCLDFESKCYNSVWFVMEQSVIRLALIFGNTMTEALSDRRTWRSEKWRFVVIWFCPIFYWLQYTNHRLAYRPYCSMQSWLSSEDCCSLAGQFIQ